MPGSARGSFGGKAPGSFGGKAPGSFGGQAAGSFGSKPALLAERRTSSVQAMKRRLTASTVWVRNFFKYDEEAVEEGEVSEGHY